MSETTHHCFGNPFNLVVVHQSKLAMPTSRANFGEVIWFYTHLRLKLSHMLLEVEGATRYRESACKVSEVDEELLLVRLVRVLGGVTP